MVSQILLFFSDFFSYFPSCFSDLHIELFKKTELHKT